MVDTGLGPSTAKAAMSKSSPSAEAGHAPAGRSLKPYDTIQRAASRNASRWHSVVSATPSPLVSTPAGMPQLRITRSSAAAACTSQGTAGGSASRMTFCTAGSLTFLSASTARTSMVHRSLTPGDGATVAGTVQTPSTPSAPLTTVS